MVVSPGSTNIWFKSHSNADSLERNAWIRETVFMKCVKKAEQKKEELMLLVS